MKYYILIIFFLLKFLATNAQNWNDVGGGVDGFIYTLKTDSILNRLYVGGDFAFAGNIPANNIAFWDGNSWNALGNNSTFKGGMTTIESLLIFNGDLIIGGRFDSIDNMPMNNIARWDGVNWMNLGMGLQPSGSVVKSLEVYNGELYAGGDFFNSGNDTLRNIGKWNGNSWENLIRGLDSYANSLCVYNNKLIVSGPFFQTFTSDTTTISCNSTVSWNGLNWENFGCNLADDGLCIKEINDTLYSSGASGLNFYDGALWQSLPSPVGGPQPWIVGLEEFKNSLYVCGYFTQPPKVARFNGSGYDSICDMNGIVEELEVFQNELYAGGLFTLVDGITVGSIAKYTLLDGVYEADNQVCEVYPNPYPFGSLKGLSSNCQEGIAARLINLEGRVLFEGSLDLFKTMNINYGYYILNFITKDEKEFNTPFIVN